MREKKLHKLGKTDLLTIIYKQEKQIQQLTKEVEELKKQLEDRTINLEEAGSIAEASLKINKIFEVAQQAADEYLKSIKEVNKHSHENAHKETSNDKTNSELINNRQGKGTYEKYTNDKNNKELILINNKIGKPKIKFTKKVLILFVSLVLTLVKGITIIGCGLKTIIQKSKLKMKIKLIKFKCKIQTAKQYLQLIYNKAKEHLNGCLTKHKQRIYKFKNRNKKASKTKLLTGESEIEFKLSEAPLTVVNNELIIRKVKIKVIISKYLLKFLNKAKLYFRILFLGLKKIVSKASKSIYKVIKRIVNLAKQLIKGLILHISKFKKIISKYSIKLIVKIKCTVINVKNKFKKSKKALKKENKAPEKKLQISMSDLERELKRRKEKKIKLTFIKTLAYSAMVIIAFAIITSTSLFKILQVSGTSMTPTLTEGELLITSKYFEYKKGDMVAFYYNDNVLIKRVIATENDIVNIEYDGTVYVNSVKLEEKYVKQLTLGNCDITFPYQVPKNSVFILGDNREESIDSRSKALGSIAEDKIIGKIQFKLNPFVIY